jgi:tetratricopeptide (TPR) repeat protein
MSHCNDPPTSPLSSEGIPAGADPAGSGEPDPINIEPVPPEPVSSTTQQGSDSHPAGRPPMTAERLAAEITRLDRVLLAVVLVFAFFLGSQVARNSDLWLHLATGRLLANGQYTFGSDPFAYTSAGHAWINHSWLWGFINYEIWERLGGVDSPVARAALVVLKALLVVAAAWFMLQVRRPFQSSWLTSACVGLALYTMSARLLLQPTVVSYFFLAITLYLLYRWRSAGTNVAPAAFQPSLTTGEGGDERARNVTRSWRQLAALPILFVLWVNLDEWFLLGPLTVGLFLIGELVQRYAAPSESRDQPAPGELGHLAVAGLIGTAACLISPYTLHGFTLPTEIWALVWGSDIQVDPDFKEYFYWGLGKEYLTNLSAYAYVLLLGVGVGSFVLVRSELQWWRLVLWGPFAVLSVCMSRTIPFFAVIAGPITALNLQDFAAKQFGIVPRLEGNLKNWSLGGRLASIGTGLLLLALAWPGSLPPGRRVAWDVAVDPSLQKAAEKIRELRQKGVIAKDSHGFNTNPRIASYFAWFCPEGKGFLDYRLQLFPDVMNAFTETKVALHPKVGDPEVDAARWRQTFSDDRFHIDHIVINHADQRVTLPVVVRLWRDATEWTLLYLDGQTTIYGWDNPLSPARTASFKNQQLNFGELAFGRTIAQAERAPATGPEPPEKTNFWAWYLSGGARRPLEVDEAGMCLAYGADVTTQLQDGVMAWHFIAPWVTPVAAAPSAPGGLLYVATIGPMAIVRPQALLRNVAIAPPGAGLLAVRAARRAIAESPENPDSYVMLGKAYHMLWYEQEKPWATSPASLLERVRRTAIVNAYQTALMLRPEEPRIYFYLAEMYADMGYIDLEMDYRSDGVRVARAAGPAGLGLSVEQFNNDVGLQEEILRRRQQATGIQASRAEYEMNAENKPPLMRAQLALQRGLVKQAKEVLLEADRSQLGDRGEGGQLLAQILTETGQADEVLKAGFPVDELQQGLIAVVYGNYRQARENFQHMAKGRRDVALGTMLMLSRMQLFRGEVSPSSTIELGQLVAIRNEIADMQNVSGVLALEEGDTAEAARIFEETLKDKRPASQQSAMLSPMAATAPYGAAALLDAASRVGNQMRIEPATRPVAVQYAKLLKAQGN